VDKVYTNILIKGKTNIYTKEVLKLAWKERNIKQKKKHDCADYNKTNRGLFLVQTSHFTKTKTFLKFG